MDALFFFLGIVAICLTIATCTVLGMWLHHRREVAKQDLRAAEVSQMFILSQQMVDRGMLPPAARTYVQDRRE